MDGRYARMLDAETIAFIRETEGFYPADAVDSPIEKQREYYDELCRAFDAPFPEKVSKQDERIDGPDGRIQVRHYKRAERKSQAHVVYFHGGGFVVGGLESHDSICAEICAQSLCDLTAVDYRLAPEHVHPAPYRDCQAAFDHLSGQLEGPFVLAGDSAGGNLAAAVAHASRGAKGAEIIGQVLIYPGLGSDTNTTSFAKHAHAPLLFASDCEYYARIRSGGAPIEDDVTAYPLADTDYSRLPPTVLVTADCDPLRDDADLYNRALRDAGTQSHWINEEGLIHGYLRARHSVSRARRSFTRIVDAIDMLAERRWEFD